MPLGLFTSPLSMIFSLLLMQGISLTMFRAFLNQAITRVDPLKFSFNLGNTNTSGTSGSSSSSTNPLLSLLQSQPVPTPAPLVDQRVLDLVQLIRAIAPAQTAAQPATSGSAPAAVQVLPAMSAPIIAALPATSAAIQPSAPANPTNYPQIIILPQYQMKTSASNQIPVILRNKLAEQASTTSTTRTTLTSTTTSTESARPEVIEEDFEEDQEEVDSNEVALFENKLKRRIKKRRGRKEKYVVFEAVGLKSEDVSSNIDNHNNNNQTDP